MPFFENENEVLCRHQVEILKFLLRYCSGYSYTAKTIWLEGPKLIGHSVLLIMNSLIQILKEPYVCDPTWSINDFENRYYVTYF